MKKQSIWLGYFENFAICKGLDYIYLEQHESLICRQKIKIWFLNLLNYFKDYEISIVTPSKVILEFNENTFIDSFLFYSIENAIEEKIIILSKNIEINNNLITKIEFDNLIYEFKNSIIIQNDGDGLGLYFIANNNSFSFNMLKEKLKTMKYNEYSITDNI